MLKIKEVSKKNILSLNKYFELLQRKWNEVPGGDQDRILSKNLLNLTESKLLKIWDLEQKKSEKVRFFWQFIYKDKFREKKVLEIGSGLGFDGIFFLQNKIEWTFCDIVEDNLEVIKKIIKIKNIKTKATFIHIKDFNDFRLIKTKFDFIVAVGSLLNLPYKLCKLECHELIKLLKKNGRWLELSYPKERWIREGRHEFNQWGKLTDGIGTPWIEYYDLKKMRKRFYPYNISVNLAINIAYGAFNWFDFSISKDTEAPRLIFTKKLDKSINVIKIVKNYFFGNNLWFKLDEFKIIKNRELKTFVINISLHVFKGSIGLFIKSQNNISSEIIVESSSYSQNIEFNFSASNDVFLLIRNHFQGISPSYKIKSYDVYHQ